MKKFIFIKIGVLIYPRTCEKIIVDHINGIFTEGVFTEKQVKTKINSVKKRYRITKEKKSQSGIETSEGVFWPHYDVYDRLWAVKPKTDGIPGGMDACQSSTPVVVGITNERSFVNPSEPSTEVPDLNVDMENDEHEELEENRSHVQGTENAEQLLKLMKEGLRHLPQPIHPLTTKLMLMLLVKGHRRSENNLKLIKILDIWRMHCRYFLHYIVKVRSQGWNKCKKLKCS